MWRSHDRCKCVQIPLTAFTDGIHAIKHSVQSPAHCHSTLQSIAELSLFSNGPKQQVTGGSDQFQRSYFTARNLHTASIHTFIQVYVAFLVYMRNNKGHSSMKNTLDFTNKIFHDFLDPLQCVHCADEARQLNMTTNSKTLGWRLTNMHKIDMSFYPLIPC